ncbi:MAG: hypothetical protein Kow0031_19280 [Anaerolineae bacterium]
MSCDSRQRQVAQAAGVSGGVSQAGSKAAGVAGQVGQISGVARDQVKQPVKVGQGKVRRAVKTYQKLPAKKKEKLWEAVGQAALEGEGKRRQQLLGAAVKEFGVGVVAAAIAADIHRAKKEGDRWGLEQYQALASALHDAARAAAPEKEKVTKNKEGDGSKKTARAENNSKGEKLPTQYHINIGSAFSPEEIDRLQTTALLSSVAAKRQLEARRLNAERGHGHSDPRAQDWMTQDLNNFRFVSRQLGQARRNGGKLDTSALDEAELLDLWEFSRFEADRALRNVDHLLSGWSHLKGETADYLGGQLRQEARFYSFLAQQLEPRITPELRDKYQSWDVDEGVGSRELGQ